MGVVAMYYTLNLVDLACVAIIIMGFSAFVKILPKSKRSTRSTIDAIASQRKRVAVYGTLLIGLCIACAAPSVLYFLDGSAAIEKTKAQAAFEEGIDKQELDPPNIAVLLKKSNEEHLVTYLRRMGETGMHGWSAESIRLDHEGSRPLSSLYCQSIEKERTLQLADLESLDQIDQINLSTYVQASTLEQAIEKIESTFDLPRYTVINTTYATSQPYESSQGIGFECVYQDDLPWKVSGNLRKEDTYKGEDAYLASITLVRYATA
ncbi:hypothetical protein [Eggerthella timonensis]|uniref:hypothetical protein n=1 Tax=Eggerthella timonensis TaxID=1871008 RepID=UPI000C775EDD|nr:hypothetical protein [Eggerthella timonensis]